DPAAVEEHARHERTVIIERETHPSRPLGMGVTRRYDAKIIEKRLQHRIGQHELEDKDQAVSQDYNPGADRRTFRRNRVANGNHVRLCKLLQTAVSRLSPRCNTPYSKYAIPSSR